MFICGLSGPWSKKCLRNTVLWEPYGVTSGLHLMVFSFEDLFPLDQKMEICFYSKVVLN